MRRFNKLVLLQHVRAEDHSRFSRKINNHGPTMPGMKTRCHEWTGWTAHGYGYFWLLGKSVRAHRVAFFLKHGRWPRPQALHRCDNRKCVRADHLREGTHQQNMHDMVARGRSRGLTGSAHPMAKLSDAEVDALRSTYRDGLSTQEELARMYKVSRPYVSRLVRGKYRGKVETPGSKTTDAHQMP